MHAGFILIVAILLIFPLIQALIEQSDRNSKMRGAARVIAGLCVASILILGSWAGLSHSVEPTVVSDTVHEIQYISNDDGSTSMLISVEGELINLTKVMERTFPEGTKIRRIIKVKRGYGLDWGRQKPEYAVVKE